MPGLGSANPLRPPLIDILGTTSVTSKSPFGIAQLRSSVLRNIEWLLNARQMSPPRIEHFPEANNSLLTYGLPDVSLLNIHNASDRQKIAQWVKRALVLFEPRILKDSILVEDFTFPDTEGKGPLAAEAKPRGHQVAIRLQIRGLLAIEPYREPIAFDTTIVTDSGNVQVKAVE